MPATLASLGLDRLAPDEKLALIGELWDSLTAPSDVPLTDAQKRELDRRVAQYDADPASGVPWDRALAESLARWAK